MKKKLLGLIMGLAIFALSACGSKNQVKIYNWGEYIDKELLGKFEEETGIKPVYETFVTNEDMYIKLKNSNAKYDVVVPSDYMIEKMVNENMLQKIDTSKLTNYSAIGKEFLGKEHDKTNEYSVPYFWGTLGIVYNTKLVKEDITSWDALFDEKYKGQIIMMDSSRDSIGIALKKLGYSLNSRNEKELNEAKDLLVKQFPLVKAYLMDETKDVMKNGEAMMAVMYSGDAADAIAANKDLKYVIPKEGSNIFFDAMVIPANAENYDNALKFIDFMTKPENAAQNAQIGYSTAVSAAIELLPDEMKNNKVAYPDTASLKDLEVFRDPGEFVSTYDQIWQFVKGASN